VVETEDKAATQDIITLVVLVVVLLDTLETAVMVLIATAILVELLVLVEVDQAGLFTLVVAEVAEE
jgi:hypothetical protein